MFNETVPPIDHAKGESEDIIESECSPSKISNRSHDRRDGISIVTENPMESACPTVGISNISRGRRDGISIEMKDLIEFADPTCLNVH